MSRTCPVCGKPLPSGSHKHQKYCGEECCYEAQRERHRLYRRQFLLRRERRKCDFCHGEFECTINSQRRFCCKECRYRFHKIRHIIGTTFFGNEETEKFDRLGKDYRFPEGFETLNKFYRLSENE